MLYPLNDQALQILPHIRSYIDGCVNLTRCELLHPNLEIFFKEMPPIKMINTYPDITNASSALSKKLKVPRENFVLSGGSDTMIALLLNALGATTKRIILQTPNFFGWENNAILNNLDITAVAFGNSKPLQFCVQDFIKILSIKKQSLVVISNPNSPTGYTFNMDDVMLLSEACRQYGHLLLVDECFAYFSNIDHYANLGIQENILYIRSFSKCFGLAGARIAITIGPERLLSYLSRWRPDSTVSLPALNLLHYVLDHDYFFKKISDDITDSKKNFISEIHEKKPNWQAIPSGGNFVTFVVHHEDPQKIKSYLRQHGFLIRDFPKIPELRECIRIGVAHKTIMAQLLDTITKMGNRYV